MVAVSDDLIWLLVKNNNRFLVKRNGNSTASITFSSEPNNLYNLNTFKHSGLANRKTVAIAPGEGLTVNLTTTKTKTRNQPAKSRHNSHLKKDFRKMAKTVVNQVASNSYRADLKSASLARLAAVHKSLRVSKAGATKHSEAENRHFHFRKVHLRDDDSNSKYVFDRKGLSVVDNGAENGSRAAAQNSNSEVDTTDRCLNPESSESVAPPEIVQKSDLSESTRTDAQNSNSEVDSADRSLNPESSESVAYPEIVQNLDLCESSRSDAQNRNSEVDSTDRSMNPESSKSVAHPEIVQESDKFEGGGAESVENGNVGKGKSMVTTVAPVSIDEDSDDELSELFDAAWSVGNTRQTPEISVEPKASRKGWW